jgi:hypothetical protein
VHRDQKAEICLYMLAERDEVADAQSLSTVCVLPSTIVSTNGLIFAFKNSLEHVVLEPIVGRRSRTCPYHQIDLRHHMASPSLLGGKAMSSK